MVHSNEPILPPTTQPKLSRKKDVRMRKAALSLVRLFTVSCGGGDSNNACNSLKIAGGDSCSAQNNVVAIFSEVPSLSKVDNCSGAFISLTSILIAAHCFEGASRVTVASPGFLREGAQVFVHPKYDGSVASPFDVAIVRVERPLEGAAPVPLLLSRSPEPGESVVVYGYGLDENGRRSIDRIEAGEAPLKAASARFISELYSNAVTVPTDAGSPCGGDSGGPFLARDANGEYGIFGVTSAGDDSCRDTPWRSEIVASTQGEEVLSFITRVVPDVAVN